jgi:hypothetical protein
MWTSFDSPVSIFTFESRMAVTELQGQEDKALGALAATKYRLKFRSNYDALYTALDDLVGSWVEAAREAGRLWGGTGGRSGCGEAYCRAVRSCVGTRQGGALLTALLRAARPS